MGPLQKKVIHVLRTRFPDVVVDGLETIDSTGRVTGWVASDGFDELDDRERQNLLWKILTDALSPAELNDVGPIVALTLTEAEIHASSDR